MKPIGVVSTDEAGGVPSLARKALKGGNVWTVHRLDQVVGGVMVLARNPRAARVLSDQIQQRSFEKTYLAVVHGQPESRGRWVDGLWRNPAERRSYLVKTGGEPGTNPGWDGGGVQGSMGASGGKPGVKPGEVRVQEAILDYEVVGRGENMSLVKIQLEMGRTHQIRAQFSGHGFPLVGDKKYGSGEERCTPSLWSYEIGFVHPVSGKRMKFRQRPPKQWPWTALEEKTEKTGTALGNADGSAEA